MRAMPTETERARAALWSLDAGSERAEWVRLAMAARATGLAFEDFHEWSAGAGNYKSEVDCRSVWNSIKEGGGISAASLFDAARKAGWSDNSEGRPPRPAEPLPAPKQAASSKPPHDPLALWQAFKPAAPSHPYIVRKQGQADGLRVCAGGVSIAGVDCTGALVLPCYSLNGQLQSLQLVPTDGDKRFLPGVKLPPDACLIVGGSIASNGACYIVEGIGQAWSAHQATSCPAVVCFGWGRVAKVAEALRAKHPSARLVIVPDGGKEQQAEAIARHVRGAWAEMPEGSANNYDLNDHHQAHGLKAVATLLEQTKEPPQRFRLLTPADLAGLPPVRWRVRGVLPFEGIGAIFGPSGSGKSFLTLDLLATVASGDEWFGCGVKAAPVLYVALEGEAGIAQRVKAHEVKHGPVASGFRFMLQALDIRNAGDRADLVQAIKAAGWCGGVLCLDTLNRAAPGMDENDSKSMGEVISAAKAMQSELGGLVLLVHHTGKDATKGMRGHSSLHAALDAVIEVCRDNDRREWKMHKAKDGEDGEAHPFRLDVVEVGTDEDGESVTSCVIAPEENAGAAVRRPLPPKSGNQRHILDALGEVLKAAKDYGQAGAPIGRPCVQLEDAIEKTRGSLVCDAKRQTERTRAALSGLITRGIVGHRDGWIWLV